MKAILNSLILSGALLATAGFAQQNLLKDGGFENGIGVWTFGGGKFYAGFENYDCNGTGTISKSFAVTPDSISNPFYLRQTVSLKKGTQYYFRMDVVGTGTLLKNIYSSVSVFLGTKTYPLGQFVGTLNPHFGGGVGHLLELGMVFTSKNNYDNITIQFSTTRRAGLGFKIRIDHVNLFEKGILPWTHCKTSRNNSPKSISIESYGKKNELYLLFLGTKKLPFGVPIGGVLGLLELDPSGGMLMIANGVFNQFEKDLVSLPIPAAVLKTIKGKPLFWMPVQVTTFPKTITLGKVVAWGFL
jgi:predicted DNA-binding transcriptional regulator AlpA